MQVMDSASPVGQGRGAGAGKGRSLEIAFMGLLALAILLTFWSQQRYPALLKKLHAGSGVQVKGAISFDALLKVTPQMPVPERIAKTSVNWLWTNRFGMYFAVPFGAAMMTLMGLSVRPKRFSSAAGNVLCGAVAGAPMGVCTNCATPVGQSLLVGGASVRLTVAAMISSPSFNPVVVAMAFVLFPLPLAMLRVVAPLLLLVLLPVLVPENVALPLGMSIPEVAESVGTRLLRVVTQFLKNLLKLTWLTLPWMLLAAVLGATAAELVPAYGTHIAVSPIGVVAVAAFGTLLPVPMAFDVALAFILYHAGVPVPYVAAFLCTLGPVSVYSLSALGKQLGRDSAFRLAGATALIGVVAGLVAMWGRIG